MHFWIGILGLVGLTALFALYNPLLLAFARYSFLCFCYGVLYRCALAHLHCQRLYSYLRYRATLAKIHCRYHCQRWYYRASLYRTYRRAVKKARSGHVRP